MCVCLCLSAVMSRFQINETLTFMNPVLIAVLLLLFFSPFLLISYQTFIKLGLIWKLLLLPIGWFVGLLIGAISGIFLTRLLEWLSNYNKPPSESGSMGGVAWLGILLIVTLILSLFCTAISTCLTAKFFLIIGFWWYAIISISIILSNVYELSQHHYYWAR